MCLKRQKEIRDVNMTTKQNNSIGQKYEGENEGEACSIMSISKNGKTLCFGNEMLKLKVF